MEHCHLDGGWQWGLGCKYLMTSFDHKEESATCIDRMWSKSIITSIHHQTHCQKACFVWLSNLNEEEDATLNC